MTELDVARADVYVSRATGWAVTALGAVGLIAAFVLSVDKVEALKAAARNDTYSAVCDLNAFVSCSAVITSPESEAFGFPNSFLGLIGFTGVVLIGLLLALQQRLPGLLWGLFAGGLLFAAGFITWLQTQSLYDIGKLCPYCMVVWAVTIPLVVIGLRESSNALVPGTAISRFLKNWTLLTVLLWYIVVLAAIWFKFGTDLWV